MSADERDWFRLLLSVQGVGGRVALAILSVLAPGELHHAVAAKDTASIARANGVGPKLAARIVNELKDKAGSIALSPGMAAPVAVPGSAVADALSALANLGFRPLDASRAVAEAVAEVGEGRRSASCCGWRCGRVRGEKVAYDGTRVHCLTFRTPHRRMAAYVGSRRPPFIQH